MIVECSKFELNIKRIGISGQTSEPGNMVLEFSSTNN